MSLVTAQAATPLLSHPSLASHRGAQADSTSGPVIGVTMRSGGTSPESASTASACSSSVSRLSSGGGPSSTVTTQSWQASPRTRQVSQSMRTLMSASSLQRWTSAGADAATRHRQRQMDVVSGTHLPVIDVSNPWLSVGVPSVRDVSRWSDQMSFDELGRPLRDLTFCVVDLETT